MAEPSGRSEFLKLEVVDEEVWRANNGGDDEEDDDDRQGWRRELFVKGYRGKGLVLLA